MGGEGAILRDCFLGLLLLSTVLGWVSCRNKFWDEHLSSSGSLRDDLRKSPRGVRKEAGRGKGQLRLRQWASCCRRWLRLRPNRSLKIVSPPNSREPGVFILWTVLSVGWWLCLVALTVRHFMLSICESWACSLNQSEKNKSPLAESWVFTVSSLQHVEVSTEEIQMGHQWYCYNHKN